MGGQKREEAFSGKRSGLEINDSIYLTEFNSLGNTTIDEITTIMVFVIFMTF